MGRAQEASQYREALILLTDIDGFEWDNAIIDISVKGRKARPAVWHFGNGTLAVIFATVGSESISRASGGRFQRKKEVAMATVAKLKEFKPRLGYTKAQWNAMDFPEMTDEKLAKMRVPPERFRSPPSRPFRRIESRVVARFCINRINRWRCALMRMHCSVFAKAAKGGRFA